MRTIAADEYLRLTPGEKPIARSLETGGTMSGNTIDPAGAALAG